MRCLDGGRGMCRVQWCLSSVDQSPGSAVAAHMTCYATRSWCAESHDTGSAIKGDSRILILLLILLDYVYLITHMAFNS